MAMTCGLEPGMGVNDFTMPRGIIAHLGPGAHAECSKFRHWVGEDKVGWNTRAEVRCRPRRRRRDGAVVPANQSATSCRTLGASG